MPLFNYRAKKGPTEVVDGQIQADSQEQAVGELEKSGLVPITVVEAESKKPLSQPHPAKSVIKAPAGGAGSRPQGRRGRKLTARELDIFTRQLAGLIKANVPILRALNLLAQQKEDGALREVVSELGSEIKDGKTLSQAMEKYPRIFNTLYLNLIRAGEKGGVLNEVLYKLVEYREKEAEIKRKIQSAVVYPALMLLVGIATVAVMFAFFLPKLMGLFENMQGGLPLPTKILIALSNFMSANWLWILIAAVFLASLLGRTRPGSKKKFLFDALTLNLPFLNKFVKDVEFAKFARTLGMLLKNGIPVYESLNLATDTLNNDVLRGELKNAARDIVNEGASVSASLKKVEGISVFIVNMIAVGEESGKLDDSLTEIAAIYEKDIEQTVKIMTSLLEPLLILAIGSVVGFIVFAMLLPIFNIGMMAK